MCLLLVLMWKLAPLSMSQALLLGACACVLLQ